MYSVTPNNVFTDVALGRSRIGSRTGYSCGLVISQTPFRLILSESTVGRFSWRRHDDCYHSQWWSPAGGALNDLDACESASERLLHGMLDAARYDTVLARRCVADAKRSITGADVIMLAGSDAGAL